MNEYLNESIARQRLLETARRVRLAQDASSLTRSSTLPDPPRPRSRRSPGSPILPGESPVLQQV